METILTQIVEVILSTIIIVMIWAIVVGVLNLILIYENKHYYIKLRKPKKYEGKVTPIYEVCQNEIHSSNYYIRKWELRWNKDMTFTALFIPGMMGFEKYEYVDVGSYFLGEKHQLVDITRPIKEIWEEKNDKFVKKYEEEIEKEKAEIRKVEQVNKEFNQNYTS